MRRVCAAIDAQRSDDGMRNDPAAILIIEPSRRLLPVASANSERGLCRSFRARCWSFVLAPVRTDPHRSSFDPPDGPPCLWSDRERSVQFAPVPSAHGLQSVPVPWAIFDPACPQSCCFVLARRFPAEYPPRTDRAPSRWRSCVRFPGRGCVNPGQQRTGT